MPLTMAYRGRHVNVTRYLVVHELVEKTLIDRLGLHYLHAHQVAERAEESAVDADGISVPFYDRFMDKWITVVGRRKSYNCPHDLDLTPYHETDPKMIDKMTFSKENANGKSDDGKAQEDAGV
jgi:hypothetical protein